MNKKRKVTKRIAAWLMCLAIVLTTVNLPVFTTEVKAENVNLSEVDSFTAQDGDTLSGTTSGTVTIADGATITLSGATINGGIICDGSATITLVGENNVTGATNMAGIQVGGLGKTLTIRGDGSLTALGDYDSAGIGLSRAWSVDALGGDIVIEGGNITAIGHSEWGSGIGTGVAYEATVRLGNITIKGGVVKTIGGVDADGIGIGYTYTNVDSTNEIGTVTIYDTVDMVDASSVGKDIIYMHDDTDVSESKNDYFTIIDNGEHKIIYTGNPVFDIEDQTYTGEAITPKPIVSLGSLNFTEGVDYEYSYSNNVNVGSSATVTVTFKGDYAEFGSVSKSFNITKATPTVVPPTSANPKYAGESVKLVNPGSTDFGKMLYRLDDDDYSEEIPCADKGGDYTVYYEVEGSDNWSGAAGSVEIQVPVRVDVTVVGDGSVSGYDPDEFYPVGTVLTLTAEPADGYKFLSWNSDVDVPATFEYTVDAEQNSIEATFSNRYIAYTTSDGEIAWPKFSDTYDIKKNMCEDGLCVMFFGEGITEIDAFAFSQHERLTSIEIPSSIETIGDDAFSFTPLIRVDMKSKVPPQLGDGAFDAVPDEFLIHVPHGSADAYRSANGWKDYEDHIVDHDASMLVWTDDVVVPTCSETGWEAGYVCNECHKRFADADGYVEMTPVDAIGHAWGEYTLDGDQTCTDDGHKTARCTRVGCTETHTIEATGDALGTAYGAVGVYNDYSKAIIDGTSETSVLLPWDIEVAAVELNRTFTAGTFSTITLPFSMSVENVEGAVFYKFMYFSSDDGTVHIEPVRDELIANTPYLVKTTGETISFKAGTTLKRTLDATPMDKGQDEGDGWELRGNYGKMVWREGHPDLGHIYYIDDAGKLKKIEADDELGPMQAYIYFNGDISDIPCSVTGIHDFSEKVNDTTHKCANCDATETHRFSEEGICSDCGTPIPYYDVSFEDAEGNIISTKSYPYGTLAKDIIKPENPEKATDEDYAYTFTGWTPEIQDVTGPMTYSPIYDKTRIGFDSATIAVDGSWAIIDGMSSEFIDYEADGREITGDVTIYRHFGRGIPDTIVLPFETRTGDVPGFSFCLFKGIEWENGEWKLVYDYIDENQDGDKVIKANTPYIVVADKDEDYMVIKNGIKFDLDSPKTVTSEDGNWQFVGTYDYREWDSDHNADEIGKTCFVSMEQYIKFKEVSGDLCDYVYPMRAYFRYVSPLCSITGNHDFVDQGDGNHKCSVCGSQGNHDLSNQPYQTDDAGKHYQICANCTAESEHVECTPGEAVKEDIVAPTCAKTGSHNDVVYCTVCNQKLGETPVEDAATGKHSYKNVVTKATLTTNGKLETKCTVCNNVLKTEAVYAAKTVMLDKVVYTYDGKTKKPSVIIKDSKGNLISTSNYTVTYPTASKKVGEYTVKVTFKGNYKGSKSLTFKLNPVKTAISSLTAGSKSFTVKWAKKTAEVTGYQIQYSTSDKFKTGNKTVTITKNGIVKKQIKSLKAGKKYFVRVRTYKTVGKVKFYSEWSAKKAVTTKK